MTISQVTEKVGQGPPACSASALFMNFDHNILFIYTYLYYCNIFIIVLVFYRSPGLSKV